MIFKEATIYRLFEFKHSLDTFNEQLGKSRYTPINETSTFTGGFRHPVNSEYEELAIQLGSLFGFAYRMEEKKAPAAQVNELTRKRIKELEDNGTVVNKQLESDIEENARKEVLKMQVPSVHVVTGFIDAKAGWVFLNTKSSKLCEYVLGALRKAVGSFRVMPGRTDRNPSKVLSQFLCTDEVKLASGMHVDFDGKVKAVGEKASQKLSFEGITLLDNEIEVLRSRDIIQADMYFDCPIGDDDFERWAFTFNTKKGDQPFYLSKISHVPLSQDSESGYSYGIEDECFNADWLLTANLLHVINQALGESFGGFVDFEENQKADGEPLKADKDGVIWLSEIQKAASKGLPEGITVTVGEAGESLYPKARALVITEQRASVAMLQREFKIGYNRAAELIEKMEVQGVVSSPVNSGLREVLIKEGE
ncbi:MAG: recombination-associated protein RdgC [Ketobacter sp.]|nr:recombination-associated protein RdgC [Ketobacter sp.]